MNIVLYDNQEVADSYKNALLSEKIAMRRWRNEFIELWKDCVASRFIDGDEYIGGYVQIDRVNTPCSENITSHLGWDEVQIQDAINFMNQDGEQDLDMCFTVPYDFSKEAILKFLTQKVKPRIIEMGGVVEFNHMFDTSYHYGLDEVNFYNETNIDDAYVYSTVWYLMFGTDVLNRYANIVGSEVVEDGITYYSYSIDMLDMSYFNSSVVESDIYKDEDEVLAYKNSCYSMLSSCFVYSFFAQVSYFSIGFDDSVYFYENEALWFKVDYLKSLDKRAFLELISSSLDFKAQTRASGFAGTAFGSFVLGFFSVFTSVIGVIEKMPVLNSMYYQAYYALQTIGLSDNDLDNFELVYIKLRTATLLLYAGGGEIDLSDYNLSDLSDTIDTGMDIYSSLQTKPTAAVQDEEEVQDEDSNISVMRGIDATDAFYAQMVDDYSELELDDFFEDVQSVVYGT